MPARLKDVILLLIVLAVYTITIYNGSKKNKQKDGGFMYGILKKYMDEHYDSTYIERDNSFTAYIMYECIGTFVPHVLSADENGFRCEAKLPAYLMFDGNFHPRQISALARVNNNLEYGDISVIDKNGQLAFCTAFNPRESFSASTEEIFVQHLDRMIHYGADVMDREYGELLSEVFAA